MVKIDDIHEINFTNGYKMNETARRGIEDNKLKRSANSRAKYFGMSSPINKSTTVDKIKIVNSSRLKMVESKTALKDAKAMLETLFPMSIVEKKFCGC